MSHLCFRGRHARRFFLAAAAAAFGSPALADHAGPGSVGSGAGFSVFSPDTLDHGQWAAGLRLFFTKPEQRSDEELAALAGHHVHAHNANYHLNGAIGVAYGLTHHLTISAELPYVRHDDIREGEHGHDAGGAVNEVVRLGSVSGVGDLNLLAKYRLTAGDKLAFALIGGIKLPTGSTHRRSNDGERLETEHQPGTGSWDPIVGAAASARLREVTLTSSAVYQIATRGAQNTKLGDRLRAGVALSRQFGEAPHDHAAPGGSEHGHSSWTAFVELAGEWEGRQEIAGETARDSGGRWVYAAPGVRFNAASGWSAAASVAVPLWQDIRSAHPDNRYRLMMSLGRQF